MTLPAAARPDCTAPGFDAILLAGFGGPERPEDVMPFLRNVTRGRGIPQERLVEVGAHYRALGGVSPINGQNRALREALQSELTRRGIVLPVLWGNRNWAPYLADVVGEAFAAGRTRLLAIATSAYSSYSSCRQYREDLGGALASTDLLGRVRIDKVPPYAAHPGFRAPFVDGVASALTALADAGLSAADVVVVFTTHSIPLAMARAAGTDGSPEGAYVTGHLAACRDVAAQAGARAGTPIRWRLAYQSRSGAPEVPWLEPDINDVIHDLAAGGTRAVVVVPIGFISDHVEVIWDLDHEASTTATEHGMRFVRVATPGTDRRFVGALADLVQGRLARETLRAPGSLPQPPLDACGAGCCVNARASKPTIGALDSASDWPDAGHARLVASGIAAACSPSAAGSG